jgi:hypothetical protein
MMHLEFRRKRHERTRCGVRVPKSQRANRLELIDCPLCRYWARDAFAELAHVKEWHEEIQRRMRQADGAI